MFIRRALLLVIILIAASAGHAQDTEKKTETEVIVNENVKMIEFSVDPISPTGRFKDNLEGNLTGLSFRYLDQRKSSAYSFFGIQISYAHIGALSNTISDVIQFNDDTSSNFASAEVIYRHYLPYFYKIVEPFIEFGLGPKMFYTFTSTTFLDEAGTSEFSFDSTQFGMVFHADIGVTIRLYNRLFAMAKIGFNSGTATTYDVPGELVTEFPLDSFMQNTSQTNFLKTSLGLAFAF